MFTRPSNAREIATKSLNDVCFANDVANKFAMMFVLCTSDVLASPKLWWRTLCAFLRFLDYARNDRFLSSRPKRRDPSTCARDDTKSRIKLAQKRASLEARQGGKNNKA